MAIELEKKQKRFSWFALGTAIAVVVIVGAGSYYLFFAAAPRIDVVLPPPLTSATQISQVQFDPATLINSREFRALRSYAGLPSTGALGRENPFIGY